jgi:Asp-tRNA(Asn)/Glu-tRNA(Gln) amidotransferase A subunit family amidase
MPGQAEAAVRASLGRIAERDKQVRAWLHVDDQGALATARSLDAERAPRSSLHGIPIGVKDVFDTADMPTTHNSPLFGGHRPALDAACVAVLRQAGAIVLGKTDTTEFAAAGRDAATANPHNPDHTPGGSSAGSAAAVADGHVRIALSTQTGGSIIRPASFCGVHGFKPTWGAISREGVKIYANSLDTVGWHAASIEDCDRMCEVFGFPAPQQRDAGRPLRIGLCRTPYWDQADEDCQDALIDIAVRLREKGATVEDFASPPSFAGLDAAHHAILWREGGAAFLSLGRDRRDLLHADFQARIASRETIDDATLRDAYDRAALARIAFEQATAGYDAILAPSAPGVAPVGRSPGNPVFNQIWTLLHMPVLSLPRGKGSLGLPIGVSLLAKRFEDRRLLIIGRQIEDLLS